MKVIRATGGVAEVELTRRNLVALLRKLDEGNGGCITKRDGDRAAVVRAVEDIEHYADRPAGPMHDPVTGETY